MRPQTTLQQLEPRTPAQGMLALGVDPRTLRSCLIDRIGHEHRLLGWINVERSNHAPLSGQVAAVVRRLGLRLGRRLWDDTVRGPFTRSDDVAAAPPLDYVGAAVAEQSELRVWTVALTDQGSRQALQRALAATRAEIVGSTVLSSTLRAEPLAHALTAARPHVLVISGGYDQANEGAGAALMHLATLISHATAQMSGEDRPAVIYAGNHRLAEAVRDLFLAHESVPQVDIAPNVLPEPGIVQRAELARLLREQQWRLLRQMPGIGRLGQWVTTPLQLTSMETAFAQLVQVWRDYHDLPFLHGVFMGSEQRLHIWCVRARPDTGFRYVPKDAEAGPEGWPPARLLSGPARVPPEGLLWWDQSGLAPLVATFGHVAPEAMLQVLTHDVFRRLS